MGTNGFSAATPDVELLPQVCDHSWYVVTEEVAYKHAKQLQQASQQDVEKALSNIFFTGNTEAKRGLKEAFYQFIETVLTDIFKK